MLQVIFIFIFIIILIVIMNNDINLKLNQFNNYLTQIEIIKIDKLESLTNEVVEMILKLKEIDADKELNSLANSVKKIINISTSDRIKIMVQTERIFKACEQKGIKNQFSSDLEETIHFLESQLKRENLIKDIDDKRLGFIHGDNFLSASGLEGGSTIKNVSFLLPYIKESGLFDSKHPVIKMLEELVEREKAKPKFDPNDKNSFKNYQEQSEDYSEYLCEKIKKMPEGERFLMSGGWKSLGSGHAMFYIVEKEQNGKYAFTVVNTGDGIQNHQAQEIELKTKYKPIFRLHDIDESLMARKEFFAALHELEITLNPKDGITPLSHSADDIYNKIIPTLQGKRDLEFEDQVDFISDQKSGTCSWMSFTKLLHSESTETKKYKSFNFALRRDSLNVYFNKLCQGKLELNSMRIELLKRCTENFAQNTLKQHKREVISKAELKNAAILVKDIQNQIKIWESSSPIKSLEIHLETITPLQGIVLKKGLFEEHEINPSIVSQDLSLALSIDQRIDKMPETLDQFQTKLEKIIDTCKNLRLQENYRLSNEVLMQFITSLGSFEKSIDLWTNGVDQEKIERTMASLLILTRILFSNISGLPEKERGSPEQFALITILAALNFKLGSKIDDEFMMSTQLPFAKSRIDESPYLSLFNPKLQGQFYEAISLLNKHKKSLSLFKWYLEHTGESFIPFQSEMISSISYSYDPLKKILKDSKFLNKLKKINSKLVNASEKEKLLFALQKWGTEDCPFPKQYQILNEMTVLILYFSMNPLLQKVKPGKEEESGKLKIFIKEKPDELTLFPTLTGRERQFENQSCYKDSQGLGDSFFASVKNRISDEGLKGLMDMSSKIYSEDLYNLNEDPINWDSRSNKAVTVKAKKGLSRQETQLLAYILSNERTKIPNLIAFFQVNPERLADVNYQLLLIYELFSVNVINTITNNPLILDKIFSFIEEHYALQKGLGNTQQQIFLLSLADQVKKFARESNSEITINSSLDIQKEFSQLISNVVDHTLEGKRLKALAYQHYIASFDQVNDLTEENYREIYKGSAYIKVFGFDEKLSFPQTTERVNQTLWQVNKKIESFNDAFHKSLLKDISQLIGIKNAQWEGQYPHFSDLNSSYRINLNPLVIVENNTVIGSLPQEFIQHPNFQKVLGNSSFITTSLKPGLFELNTLSDEKVQEKFRVYFSKQDQSLKILKLINNEWYTYIPHTDLDGILKPASLVQGHFHWTLRKDAGTKVEILVENEKDHKIESLLELSRNHQGSYQVSRWRDLKNQSVLQDLYVNYSPLSDHLNDFQPIDSITLWKDDHIEFSSLGISFKIDEKKQLIYSKNSDFKLTKLQKPPKQLPYFSGYLEMEGKQNEKRYLIPKGTVDFIQPNFVKSQEEEDFAARNNVIKFQPGNGPLSKGFKIQYEIGTRASYYELVEKNGKLIGKNPEENLYIAYLHLANKNYEAANELLKQQLVGRPKEYLPKEKELIDQLVNIQSQDESPEALAIAGKCLYLQMRNTNKIDMGSLPKLEKYYRVSKHAKRLFIGPDEEKELLEHILKNLHSMPPPVFLQRLAQLNGAFSHEKNVYSEKREIPSLELDHAVTVPNIQTVLKNNRINLQEGVVKTEPEKTAELVKMLTVPKDLSKVEETEYLRVQQSVISDAKAQGMMKFYQYEEGQIQQLHDAFEKEITNYTTKIEDQKIDILKLANKQPSNPDEAAKWQLKLAGKKKKELTIDDLTILVLQNNGKSLLKRNPHLSDVEIKELVNLLSSYLINSTEVNHLKNLSEKTLEVLREKDQQKEKALLDLNNMLRSERSYQVENDFPMLVFEYYSGFRLRENQVNTIRSMILSKDKESSHIINQLIMGSGKTKVLLPLLAFLNSRGDNVPIILAPDQLFETNLEDMRALSGELLDQEIETIDFKKEAPLTIQDMEGILKKFKKIRKNRSYCLVNQTTVSTLYLHYKEIITNLPNEPEKYLLIKQIMNTFSNEGDLIIDEVDMVLDCLKETNFSIGEWKNVNEITQTSLYNTFSEVLKDPILNEFFKMEKETESAVDEQKYEKTIKPHLAKMFIKMAGLEENELLMNYLLSSKAVKEIPKVILDSDDATKAQLALGKELIKSLFPLMMNKNCNEHFGLSHLEKSNKAIPYLRPNVPSEGSEFGTPLESMMYTMLYFTRIGVKEKQLKQLMDECKAEALSEYKSEGTTLNQTKGYKKFAQLNLLPEKDLFSIQESELKEASEIFNGSMENRMKFAKLYGWSEVGVYKGRLACNPQDLVGMFRSVQGFTGTLWNKDTFHKSLRPVPDISVDGKTLNILHRSDPKVTAYSMDLKNFLISLAKYDACIDVGAWFRGMSAMEAATKILENLPAAMKGIVYINDVDIPEGSIGQNVILERGSKIPKLLSQCQILESERFTYYNVTTGADIPQHALAKALVTVSKTVTLRDLLQGVWRLRGLDKKQKCDFAVPEELGRPNLVDILNLIIFNQARRQRDDNLRALRQMMSQLIEHTMNRVLLSPKINVEQASEIIKDVKNFFIHSSENDLFKLFGGVETKVPIKNIVEPLLEQTIARVSELYKKHAQFEETYPLETLKSDLKELIDYQLLPEEEYQKADINYGLQMQVKKEVKVEQKSQIETKTNLEIVDDRVDVDKIAQAPKKRFCYNLFNLYSMNDDLYEREDLNTYLVRHTEQLVDCKNPGLFSSNLLLSGNFTGKSYLNANQENMIVPFQSGSKPGGVSALQVHEDGTVKLTFLHPCESQLLSYILKMENLVDYEKLSTFTPEKYLKLVVDETKAYYKKELESGSLKEQLKSDLLDYGINENWLNQIVSKGKFDQAWLEECLQELPVHFGTKFGSRSDDYLKIAKEYLQGIIEKLNSSEEAIQNSVLASFGGRMKKFDQFSLKEFYREMFMKGFKNFEEHIEQKLFENFGLDKISIRNEYFPASQLIQIFNSKGKDSILLVHPILGVVEPGKADVKKLKLDKNPEYIKAITEAKFYMGIMNGYNAEERAYLASWIKEKGAKEMETFLLKNILSVRGSEKRSYPTSAIKKIIDSI